MPRHARNRLALTNLLIAFMCVVAIASTPANEPDIIPQVLIKNLTQPREAYLAKQLATIRSRGTNRTQLDQAAIDRVRVDAEAASRGSVAGKLMGRDRDGDGRVTVEEILQSRDFRSKRNRPGRTPEQVKAEADRRLELEMAADADSDGVITIDEILVFANKTAKKNSANTMDRLSTLLALDPNGDGMLTATELENLALATYARFDLNGNGMMDGEEIASVRAAQNAGKKRATATPTASEIMNCDLPPTSENAEIFIVSATQGDSVSPVSVSGPDGVTSTATLFIEPGATPLYVVVSAGAGVVWRFEGTVSRIDKAVIIPHNTIDGPGAGVVGLPVEKVAFMKQGTCFRFFDRPGGGKGRRALATVQAALGEPVTAVIGARKLMYTALPSTKIIDRKQTTGSTGTHEPHAMSPPAGIEYRFWSRLIGEFPGGIARFDARDVIAPQPAIAYEVPPSSAGLVDLMKKGAIRKLDDAYLIIEKPIARYPAGLARAGMRIMLGKGIPEPAGGSSTLCVISEETGRPVQPRPGCS